MRSSLPLVLALTVSAPAWSQPTLTEKGSVEMVEQWLGELAEV